MAVTLVPLLGFEAQGEPEVKAQRVTAAQAGNSQPRDPGRAPGAHRPYSPPPAAGTCRAEAGVGDLDEAASSAGGVSHENSV